MIFIVGFVLSMGGYALLRYNLKWIRVKYLFAHRRLHEHIGLEISASNTAYSHLPTSDLHCHDRPLEDVLYDEDHLTASDMQQSEGPFDDPFHVHARAKGSLFNNERHVDRLIMHREIL